MKNISLMFGAWVLAGCASQAPARPTPPASALAPTPLPPTVVTTPIKVDPRHLPRIGEAYYPAASKDALEQGRCWVKMTVFPDGRVGNITLMRSSGFPRLDEACARAFDDGRFIPATEDGKPIEKSIEIPISWILKPPEQPPSEK